MCGIFAAMTRRGLSSDRCDAALKLLEHRGPDGTGIWTSRDGQWTLGHTRLSIIGLRNGSQPMRSPDGAVHVVVNGDFTVTGSFASVCEQAAIASPPRATAKLRCISIGSAACRPRRCCEVSSRWSLPTNANGRCLRYAIASGSNRSTTQW